MNRKKRLCGYLTKISQTVIPVITVICFIAILGLSYKSFHYISSINQKISVVDDYIHNMDYQYHRQKINDYEKLLYESPIFFLNDIITPVIQVNENESHIIEESMEVPEGITGNFKSYMDYRKITNKRSEQWLLQQIAETNTEGFRIYNDRYMIALGTYYSSNIGDTFNIELDSGQLIDCVIGDIKNDIHTDISNRYNEINGNIVEFIVDVSKINKTSRLMGDMSYSEMEGGIKSIVKVYEVY